jgi:hypothetical protein
MKTPLVSFRVLPAELFPKSLGDVAAVHKEFKPTRVLVEGAITGYRADK